MKRKNIFILALLAPLALLAQMARAEEPPSCQSVEMDMDQRVAGVRVTSLVSSSDIRALSMAGDVGWAATTGGLVRFDLAGFSWEGGLAPEAYTIYTTAQGLPDNRVYAVLAMDERHAWVGTEGRLDLVLVEEGDLRVVSTITVDQGLPRVWPSTMALWGSTLYLGTHGKGLWALDLDEAGQVEELRRVGLPGRRSDKILSLLVRGENLYVGTGGSGIVRLRADRKALVLGRAHGLPDGWVWSLVPGPKGLCAATMKGVACWDRGRFRPWRASTLVADLPIHGLVALEGEERAQLVAASPGTGVLLQRGARWDMVADTEGLVITSGEAAQGLAIFGTDRGLLLVGPEGKASRFLAPGPPSNDITALAVGRSGLWVGTFDQGVGHLQGGRWTNITFADGLADDTVSHVAVQPLEDGREVVWVAGPQGLSRFDGRSWTVIDETNGLASSHVSGILVKGPNVMVATTKGISWFDGSRWRSVTKASGLPGDHLFGLAIHEGHLVGASLRGLLVEGDKGVWQRLSKVTGEIPDDWVNAVAVVGEDLWVGTYDAGLARRDRWGKWRHFGPKEGLPCGWVNPNAMAEVDGQLWVGTMEGGLIVHDGRSFRRITTEEGLAAMDVTSVARGPEGVWVGTRGGLSLITRGEAR